MNICQRLQALDFTEAGVALFTSDATSDDPEPAMGDLTVHSVSVVVVLSGRQG